MFIDKRKRLRNQRLHSLAHTSTERDTFTHACLNTWKVLHERISDRTTNEFVNVVFCLIWFVSLFIALVYSSILVSFRFVNMFCWNDSVFLLVLFLLLLVLSSIPSRCFQSLLIIFIPEKKHYLVKWMNFVFRLAHRIPCTSLLACFSPFLHPTALLILRHRFLQSQFKNSEKYTAWLLLIQSIVCIPISYQHVFTSTYVEKEKKGFRSMDPGMFWIFQLAEHK